MSSNYPPGPMLESGVYDVEFTAVVYCDDCDHLGSAEVTQRGPKFMFTCPSCGVDNEVENDR